MTNNKQLLPFPLPAYLAQFVTHQLNVPIEIISEGKKVKALHLYRNTALGKFIYRSLRKSNKTSFKEDGITLFIAVSDFAGNNDPLIPCGRNCFLSLSKEETQDIVQIFENLFDVSFLEFVRGAEFGYTYTNKRKGIVHKSIIEFMDIYKISPENIKFDALVKRYQRAKKRETQVLHRFI